MSRTREIRRRIQINIDSAHERRERMAAQLDALGLPFERIGFDGRHRTPGAFADRVAREFPRIRFSARLLSGAEVGCWLSRLLRWPIDHAFGGRITSLRPRLAVLRPAVVEEDPRSGRRSQIEPHTFRRDRSALVESARRHLMSSRVGDLYYRLCQYL